MTDRRDVMPLWKTRHARPAEPDAMPKLTKRDLLAGSAALAGTAFAQPLKAIAREASAVTPALIEAARREGKLSFYSALELPVAERFGKLFEAKYPGITVRVERSGAERLYQRISQLQG